MNYIQTDQYLFVLVCGILIGALLVIGWYQTKARILTGPPVKEKRRPAEPDSLRIPLQRGHNQSEFDRAIEVLVDAGIVTDARPVWTATHGDQA